jgi:hypothetical protein
MFLSATVPPNIIIITFAQLLLGGYRSHKHIFNSFTLVINTSMAIPLLKLFAGLQ